MPYRETFLALLNPRGKCSIEQPSDLSQVVMVHTMGLLTWPKLGSAFVPPAALPIACFWLPPSLPKSSGATLWAANPSAAPQHLHFSTHFLHPVCLRIRENTALTPKSLWGKWTQFHVWVRKTVRKRLSCQHPLITLLTCFMSFPHSLSSLFI